MISLTTRRQPRVDYYGSFLDDAVIAVINDHEVEGYFRFMNKIYVPLGNPKMEKYIYESLSFVLGKYPNVYVAKSDYERLIPREKNNPLHSVNSHMEYAVILNSFSSLYFDAGLLSN